jgi:hypothetical protein
MNYLVDRNNNFMPAADNIFGIAITKKQKERKEAKQDAKAVAKDAGLTGKAVRLAGKAAKLETKVEQKGDKASAGLIGRTAKVAEKASIIAATGGKTISKEERMQARDVGQEAKANALEEQGKSADRIERIRARDGETGIQRTAEDVVTAPLLPFKSKMVSMLKDKGVAAPKRMADITEVFYETFVKNSDTFMPIQSAFMNRRIMTTDHAAVILPVIVNAVIDFFKMAKDKKNSGQPMSKTEEKAAKATEIVEQQLEEKAKEEAAESLADKFLNDWRYQAGLAALLLLIFLPLIKKAFK